MQPSDDAAGNDGLLALHDQLLLGIGSAAGEIAEQLLIRLASPLLHQYFGTDPDVIWDGVTEAILNYLQAPGAFDPSRGIPLEAFLALCARRYIADKLRSEQRRRARETTFFEIRENNFVELGLSAANIEMETEINWEPDLGKTLKDPVDRKIFELCVNGERRTEVFAGVLILSRSDKLKYLSLLWLSLNFMLYRLGFWFTGLSLEHCKCLGNLTDSLGLNPKPVQTILQILVLYLFAGSAIGLLFCILKERAGTRVAISATPLQPDAQGNAEASL